MKNRHFVKSVLLFLSLLAVSGCSYTIKYTLKSTRYGRGEAEEAPIEAPAAEARRPAELPEPAETLAEPSPAEPSRRTFAVEHARRKGGYGYSTEKKLLDILAQSLESLGWSLAGGKEKEPSPDYLFSVDYERSEPTVNPGFGFGVSTGGGGGFFFRTVVDTSGRGNLRVIRIKAFRPETARPENSAKGERREYVWTAEIRSESPAGSIIDLARHAVPKALEGFPETGYWELKAKIAPRGGDRPSGR